MKPLRKITNNFSLKVVSLLVAIMAWFYISGELERTGYEEESFLKGLGYGTLTKVLPIEANLTGAPPAGFTVNKSAISIEPKNIVVVGHISMVGELKSVATEPIDLSEHTKTFTVSASLEPIPYQRPSKEQIVRVTVPVEREVASQ